MGRKRRSFQRPLGKRRYRKLFLLAVEGTKTEPMYFTMLNEGNSTVHVKCLKSGKGSSPPKVLRTVKEYLREKDLRHSDEAWLVVDRDQWNDDQLMALFQWSKTRENYEFALSNPNFEYWILLHFEDPPGALTASQCNERLKRFLPDYDKGIEKAKISPQMIQQAVDRAKKRDIPPCKDWPKTPGNTTVYRLVERIIEASQPATRSFSVKECPRSVRGN